MTNQQSLQDRLKQAADLLADGASQREVQRTTGLARETIRKNFPGAGWTFTQGGEFQFLKLTKRDYS